MLQCKNSSCLLADLKHRIRIITGPYVLGWVEPLSWGNTAETNYVTYEFSRLVVGIQVLFTGISLPKAYLRKEALSLTVLLFGVMTIAWFISALLIWGLIPNLTYLESLAISAAITPTDPVLANRYVIRSSECSWKPANVFTCSITKGRFAEKHVPYNLRNIIVAESGANDGLGFPFLFLALYLLNRHGEDAGTSIGTEVGRWIYGVLLYRILLSCIYGAIIGVLAHKTLKWAETRGYIDRDNFFAYGFGLALFTLGTTGLFNSDDILGCFVAGNAFTWWDWYRVRTQVEEEDSFQDILDSLLNAAIFIYIGAIIPWADYNTAASALQISPWRIVVLGICVLTVRRLPWVVALHRLIPAITNFQEALFAGWFGPIGVGAVFYIQVALREIPDDGTRDRLRAVYTPVVLFCVFSSVLTHGITIPIAKLGPNIVRKTTSLSAQRTISFTVKHDTNSMKARQENQDGEEQTRHVWNPLWSLVLGLQSVFFFWQKDSFWRKETEYQKNRRVLRSDNISKPMNAEKLSSIEGEVSGNSDRDSTDHIAMNESTDEEAVDAISKRVDPVAPSRPNPTANPNDTVRHGASAGGYADAIKKLYNDEWKRERKEAIDEASRRKHLQSSTPNSDASGSIARVRWQDHANAKEEKSAPSP